MSNITKKYLKECINYNQNTGLFHWKERPLNHFTNINSMNACNSRFKGKECVRSKRDKYIRISINKTRREAHIWAWLYVYGELPGKTIDHINGNRFDNRITNLRDVSISENNKNLSMNKNNKSGIMGVHFCNNSALWVCRIWHGERNVYLKKTKDFFEACCARKAAEIKYGYHENHGKRKSVR